MRPHGAGAGAQARPWCRDCKPLGEAVARRREPAPRSGHRTSGLPAGKGALTDISEKDAAGYRKRRLGLATSAAMLAFIGFDWLGAMTISCDARGQRSKHTRAQDSGGVRGHGPQRGGRAARARRRHKLQASRARVRVSRPGLRDTRPRKPAESPPQVRCRSRAWGGCGKATGGAALGSAERKRQARGPPEQAPSARRAVGPARRHHDPAQPRSSQHPATPARGPCGPRPGCQRARSGERSPPRSPRPARPRAAAGRCGAGPQTGKRRLQWHWPGTRAAPAPASEPWSRWCARQQRVCLVGERPLVDRCRRILERTSILARPPPPPPASRVQSTSLAACARSSAGPPGIPTPSKPVSAVVGECALPLLGVVEQTSRQSLPAPFQRRRRLPVHLV